MAPFNIERIIDFNARVEVASSLNDASVSLKKAQLARNSSFIKAGTSLLNVLPAFGKLKFSKGGGGVDTTGFKSRFDLGGQLDTSSFGGGTF